MSHSHVTREERVVITYLNMMNVSQAEIARRIGHHRGTVGRELRRNRDIFGNYHYEPADDREHDSLGSRMDCDAHLGRRDEQAERHDDDRCLVAEAVLQ